MCHKLPFPLYPRVFSVLVITAKTGREASIDMQIPIDIRALPEAFYSNGRNLKEGDSAQKRKRPVLGFVTIILFEGIRQSAYPWLILILVSTQASSAVT